MSAHALNGLRVLEVGNYIAGPYCGTLLADLGAQVTKVEDPNGGDVVRTYGAMFDDATDSATFLTLNRNKRSLALDLKSEDGKKIFMTLAAGADVVIENLRPGTMTRLGFAYEDLSEQNPGLIYLSASGWGQTGPLAADAGLDIMAQARSGLMSVTGAPGGDPVKAGVPVCDISCAMYGAIAVLAALNHRNQTGQGQQIDVSLFESGVSFALWEWAKYSATGQIPQKLGAVHPSAAPYQAVRASDGWFTIGAATSRTWSAMCQCMGLDDLTTDTRFVTNADRMVNREALITIIEEITRQEPVTHWVDALRSAGVPVAPINNYQQVFSDDQLVQRDWFWESESADGLPVRQMGSPMRFSKTPTARRNAAPGLGQNSVDTLRELGYSDRQIDELAERGVIRTAALAQSR